MSGLNSFVTDIFNRVVSDYMVAVPTVDHNTPCEEAVRLMRKRFSSCVVVLSPENNPVGILTERDIVHKITFLSSPSVPVSEVMSGVIHTIRQDDYLFHGIATMHRLGIHHLPVIDDHGHLAGVLPLHSAMTKAMWPVVDLINRVTHGESVEGLAQVKQAETEVVEVLLNESIPTAKIQKLLSDINNDIYCRILSLVIKDLVEEGWGEPPIEFSVIVMGSGGRQENFLYPDQDYGFLLEEHPQDQQALVDAYFSGLAERMSQILDNIGFPSCRGQVMAQNPLWRKTIPDWCTQVDQWLEQANEQSIRFSDIFFDFRHIYGNQDLSKSLREYVTGTVQQNHAFLKEMHRIQQSHGVALNLFGKLAFEQKDDPYKGMLNLKYHGILPLVETVRLLSLRAGIATTSTSGRMAALHECGVLSFNEQDSLGAAYHHLSHLLLRQQIRDYRKGIPVSSYVPPAELTSREQSTLVDSLRTIKTLQGRVHYEFSADVF